MDINKKAKTFFKHYGFKLIATKTKKINDQEITESTFLLS
jgi:hypothetical protein